MTDDLLRPSRRQFIGFGAGAFVIASLPVAARRRRERLVRRTIPVMGTFAELAVLHRDPRLAGVAIDAAATELRRIEVIMTRFSRTSDIGRANNGAARAPVAVSGETALVVDEALAWAHATDGTFDPAIGGAVALWDVANRSAPPEDARIHAYAGRELYRHVRVEQERHSSLVSFDDPAVQLDLGGIAKGYAVDRAADVLRRWGVASALVNVGGDLYAIGKAPDGEAWRVGIQDPADDRRTIASLEIADAAVATSGSYRQYFRHRGRRYHHLLDPVTGAPSGTPTQSLTVRAARCIDADAAATALYAVEPDRARGILARRAPDAHVVHTA